jgi:riboflavin synthase
MFTGLVEDVGTVARLSAGAVTDLWVDTALPAATFALGESIACDGCCLTVVDVAPGRFHVQAAPETLRRTTLGDWKPGTRINLERALKVGDRLGGHMVQGHVDGVTRLLEARSDGGSWFMALALPPSLAALVVEKGSVCLDGVSLTVNRATREFFEVQLIPETQARTTLGAKAVGAALNLEVDVVGRYVLRKLELEPQLTEAAVRARGF